MAKRQQMLDRIHVLEEDGTQTIRRPVDWLIWLDAGWMLVRGDTKYTRDDQGAEAPR